MVQVGYPFLFLNHYRRNIGRLHEGYYLLHLPLGILVLFGDCVDRIEHHESDLTFKSVLQKIELPLEPVGISHLRVSMICEYVVILLTIGEP